MDAAVYITVISEGLQLRSRGAEDEGCGREGKYG
jgi:hypothetical protein